MAAAGIDPAPFRPEAVSPEVKAFNEAFLKAMASPPPPGQERRNPMAPKPPSARAIVRDVEANGLKVGVRILPPASGSPRGAYLHLHGGGLIMGSADQDDGMLARIADNTGLVCVAVEYRLAPAHPYPAAWDDCEAAAAWLAKNVKSEFGGNALAIGGESAGATLAVPTLVRMRDKHGFTGFQAANLSYGNYDTTMTPDQHWIGKDAVPVNEAMVKDCSNQYAPAPIDRRDPDLSALYADVRNMPAALFTVGTQDVFLDDTLFMYARWVAAGNEAELAVYPGGVHGFNVFPLKIAEEANARIDAFLKAKTAP